VRQRAKQEQVKTSTLQPLAFFRNPFSRLLIDRLSCQSIGIAALQFIFQIPLVIALQRTVHVHVVNTNEQSANACITHLCSLRSASNSRSTNSALDTKEPTSSSLLMCELRKKAAFTLSRMLGQPVG
jgi:hypothetical protein